MIKLHLSHFKVKELLVLCVEHFSKRFFTLSSDNNKKLRLYKTHVLECKNISRINLT